MSTKTKMYRKGGAEKIVVPVPVAGYHAIEKFSRMADEEVLEILQRQK